MLDSSATRAEPSPSHAAGRYDVPALQREFGEQGYVVLKGVVSKTALAIVRDQLSEEFQAWQRSTASFRGGGLMSGHLNCYPGELARGVLSELRDSGTLELTQSLLPTSPRALRLGCNFNLPGSVEQHYHIDGVYLESFMVLNVCVVDTDLRNGAIDIIPRTHQRFYKYWEFATGRVYRSSKRLPMSQGDVLLRTSALWHRGMPNHTNAPRPMLAFTLGEKGVDTDNPFAHAGGKVEFQTNWFTTSLLGRARERATVAAPIIYSAYRFARSLVGNKGYASF